MKEAATIAHPQPPSSTLVDGAMVLMLLLPSVKNRKKEKLVKRKIICNLTA